MVSIVYAYKNLPESDKEFLEKYLTTKIDRLATLVKSFDGATCRLEVRAEKFATKSAYKIGMQLHLSGHQIIAEEDDHTVIEAVDLALDKLVIQLRKLVDKKNYK
jgi:ribosomal subunit interface protein